MTYSNLLTPNFMKQNIGTLLIEGLCMDITDHLLNKTLVG